MSKIDLNTPGWLGALLIHGAILLIPISFLAVQHSPWREVEFRVMEEPPPQPASPKANPKHQPKPVLRDLPLKAAPSPPVRMEEGAPVVPEKAWIETAVPTTDPTVGVATANPTAAVPSRPPAATSGEAKAGNPGVSGKAGNPGGGEGGSDNFPHFLHREMPVYPPLARRMGREGKVVLRLHIDETGTLQQVEVVESSGFEFTRAAVEAVKKSTFRAAQQNGRPVPSRAILPVQFILKEERHD